MARLSNNNLRRQRTVVVDKGEVDFRVLEFSCRDSSVLSSLGQHCKESRWKICVGSDAMPVEIKLHVDKNVISSPEVSVEWNGDKVFPSGNGTKGKLREDFTWKVPFRGTVKGLQEKNFFEIRPEHMSSEQWFTATLISQREDGLFKAVAMMPDGKSGHKEVMYPAVRIENIREASGMKKSVTLPHRTLLLEVPKSDPLNALLYVDQERITHYFGRLTPPPAPSTSNRASRKDLMETVHPTVNFKVSKDRKVVNTDCGHSVLQYFLEGAVRSVRQDIGQKLRKSWTIQIGPFAEHTVELEKKHGKNSKTLTLTVDGELLVECNAEDIESRPDFWEAHFAFVGERFLDWEVFETDADGHTLDSKGNVRQGHKVHHACVVSFAESDKDVHLARFTIDDVDFEALDQSRQLQHEDKLTCAPEALLGSYNLQAPFKVSDIAPTGFAAAASNMRKIGAAAATAAKGSGAQPGGGCCSNSGGGGGGSFGFFGACCGSQKITKDDIVMSR